MMYHKNQPKYVRWPISMSLLGLALAVILSMTAGVNASVGFTDGTFNLADWQTTKSYWGNGGSITLSQIASGGNPGQFLEVDLFMQNAGADPSVVYVLHTRNGATYTPSVQGEITAVDFSVNFKNLQTLAGGMAFGLALKQDGKIYNNFRELSGTLTGWQTEMGLGLQETSFGLWESISYSYTIDFSQNPDFSASGSLIEFGLFTGGAHTEDDNPAIENVGFDNWSVTVIPEPATFAFLTLGALILKKRKK